MRTLHSSYPLAKIGSLALPEPGAFKIGPFGSSLKKDELTKEGIPVVGIENVLANRFVGVFRRFISQEKFEQLSQYLIKPGDVLVTTMGTVGRAAVVPHGLGTAIIDSHLFRMRVDQSKAHPNYLCFGINGYTGLKQEIVRMASGAIMAGLNTKILRECSIPLPPLSEQQRLAAVLTDQIAAVDRAQAAAEAQLEAAKGLPTAYLRAVFNGPEAKQWPRRPLRELLLTPLKTGISRPTVSRGDKMCLTLSAVRNEFLDLAASKTIELSNEKADGNWVRPGAFYVVRGNGNRSLVGRGSLAPASIPTPILYPDLLIQVDFNYYIIRGQYLALVWNSPDLRADIENRARTSAGIYKINQANLGEVRVPFPPLSEQDRIRAVLTEQIATIVQTRHVLETQLDTITVLPAALLRRAFAGEL